MKPRTRRLLAGILAGVWIFTPLPRAAWAGGTPVPDGKGSGKKKRNADGSVASPTPTATKADGSISLPLLVGRSANQLRIPDMDLTGKLLSQLLAQKATRLDDDRVKLEGMRMDFNQPDGKQDFHIVMPASILNLKTHFITSDDPVTVRTAEFELTGEKMEFNTVEREGRLMGKVRMVVHNLKQLTGEKEAGEKTE